MQWYNPSNGTWDGKSEGNPSGAYLFKPKIGDQTPKYYSKFHSTTVLKDANGDLAQEIVMYFRSELNNNDQVYTAHARLVEGQNLIEWEIQMNGIPVKVDGVSTGMEVVAKWELVGADNAGVFYTDSNGLEMQKRVLN